MKRTIAVAVALFCVASTSVAATFIVTSNADSGAGTLRDAITQANLTAGNDLIEFNIAGSPLITLASSLPAITDVLSINGLSQPGAPFVPHVEINGNGFAIFSTSVTGSITGFALNRATTAIEVAIPIVTGTSGVSIQFNYIGLDLAGTTALPNTVNGVLISNGPYEPFCCADPTVDISPNNVISGNSGPGIQIDRGSARIVQNIIGLNAAGTAALPNIVGIRVGSGAMLAEPINITDDNVISGNTGPGILIQGGLITIRDNKIGTDSSGTIAIGNLEGVNLSSLVATTATVDGNVISGNASHGIHQFRRTTSTIVGNVIGLNAAGTASLPNGGDGIRVANDIATIGGLAVGEGNVIAGNTVHGIEVVGTNNAATILGNLIGINAAGTPFPNGGDGVVLASGANDLGGSNAAARNVISGNVGAGVRIPGSTNIVQGNLIGTNLAGTAAIPNANGITITGNNNLIGGTGANEGNLIAFNTNAGVRIDSGTGNRILGNSIHDNGALGIDLVPLGVTPNDAGDVDAGANGLQNFPVLTQAVNTGGTTAITGMLATASGTYTVQYFANTLPDPSGNGEGDRLLGTQMVTTDVSGNAPLAFMATGVNVGEFVSATATNTTTNDTSEFGPNVVVDSPGSLQFSSPTYSVGESTGTVTITITRTGGSAGSVSVDYTTSNGTATAGSDYLATSATVMFAAGETSKTFTVTITSDTLDEPGETFGVALSNPTGGATLGAPSTATVTIMDDDAAPSISVTDVFVTEGNAGTTTATFVVSLSTASAQTASVDFATADQTAAAGSDYAPNSGSVTFAPGETSKNVDVLVNGDMTAEVNETFALDLTNPMNATVSDGQGIGTILDDDGAPQLAINNVSQAEGTGATTNFVFTVTLAGATAQTVTVNYTTANGTATAPADYATTGGTVTFLPGTTSQMITVPVVADGVNEPDETFTVILSAPANATIAVGTGTGTIQNDDAAPTLAINSVSQAEGNSGTSNFVFTVTLTGSTSQTVTVNYATADGTATAPSDYTATSGTLTFMPGTLMQNILVSVAGDAVSEANETFTVVLSSPVAATIATGTGTGTIVDDDSGSADLSLTKTVVEPGPYFTGQNITYTIVVTNAGPIAATSVTVTDPLPAGTTFVSANSTQGTCSGMTTCTVGTLASGASATITFVVRLDTPGNIVNTATASSATFDAVAANNTASVAIVAGQLAFIPVLSDWMLLALAGALAGLAMIKIRG